MKNVRSQKQLIDFLTENPNYYLEWCLGARDSWYWLNADDSTCKWLTVTATAANAAIRAKRVRQIKADWKSRRYILVAELISLTEVRKKKEGEG